MIETPDLSCSCKSYPKTKAVTRVITLSSQQRSHIKTKIVEKLETKIVPEHSTKRWQIGDQNKTVTKRWSPTSLQTTHCRPRRRNRTTYTSLQELHQWMDTGAGSRGETEAGSHSVVYNPL